MSKHYTIEGLKLFAAEYAATLDEYPDEIYVSHRDDFTWSMEDFLKWLEEKEDVETVFFQQDVVL